MKLINKLYITIASIAVMSMTTSCEDFLTTAPSTDLTDTQIIKDVSGLNMLLQGTYRQMRDGDGTPNFYSPEGIKAVSTVTGGDMMINDEQVGDLWYFSIFSPQRYVSSASIPCDMWYKMYRIIGNANIIITSADGAAGSEELKGEIKGQALALRARCYFNLTQLSSNLLIFPAIQSFSFFCTKFGYYKFSFSLMALFYILVFCKYHKLSPLALCTSLTLSSLPVY